MCTLAREHDARGDAGADQRRWRASATAQGVGMTGANPANNPFPTHTLPNGLRIVAQPMDGVESLALGFCVATGARDEQPAEAGVGHFIDGLAFQGTARR